MPEENRDCQCKMEQRIVMLEQDSDRNQATHREFYNRFEAISEKLARNDERYTQIIKDTGEIKQDIKETKTAVQALNEKPARRWESLIAAAISAIVGVLIGFLAVRLGMG